MPAVGCFGARKLQVSERLRGFVCSMQIEMSEVKKEFYEFKRDVVGGERNFRSGKTASEKVRHSRPQCLTDDPPSGRMLLWALTA